MKFNVFQIGSTIFHVGKVLIALAWSAPRILLQRRRGVAIFRTQLQLHGVDEHVVRELTRTYKQMGAFKEWIPRKEA